MKNSSVFYGGQENEKQAKKIHRLMSGVTIVVIRWNGVSFRGSKPCKHCCEHMKKIGIKTVYFSNDDGSITRTRVKNLNSTHICMARQKIITD
jgi:deoxycytidylate deaminase